MNKKVAICDQVMRWKLDSIGMNPTAESYLLLHRFGTVSISSIYFLRDVEYVMYWNNI